MEFPEVASTLVELGNGLVLIVAEQHHAPVASVQVWCNTGSIHEGKLLGAGLTHLLEHMLFKGTEQRSAQQISETIHALGGYLNAYTTFDRTVFWVDCPASGVRSSLSVLADMLFCSRIDPDELRREMDVIRREFEIGYDDPDRMLSQLTYGNAFQVHPCRFPVIGVRPIFDQIKREEVVEYYRRRYVPNNMFVVVAGAVDQEQTVRDVEEVFGRFSPRPIEPIYLPDEPRQLNRRQQEKAFPTDIGYFSLAWHVPPIWHPHVPALDVLSVILGNGASSVLHQELREKKGAVYGIGAFAYTPSHTGLFTISGSCSLTALDRIEQEVGATLRKWRSGPWDEKALQRAKRIVLANAVEQLQTVKGVATDLALNWAYARDLGLSRKQLRLVEEVDSKQILAVFDRYLVDDGINASSLRPEKTLQRTPRPESKPRTAELGTLANGLKVVLFPDERLPMVQLSLVFQGGLLCESAADNGITRLYTQSLLKGTTSRDAEEIANEIESLGGILYADSGSNSLRIGMGVLAPELASAVALFADVVLRPTFPEAAVEVEKVSQIAAIKAEAAQPSLLVRDLLRRGIYGKHPYGMNLLGTIESVGNLTADALKRYHEKAVRGSAAVMGLAGQFDPETALGLLEEKLGQKPGFDSTVKFEVPNVEPFASETIVRKDPRNQAILTIGYLVADLFSPDRIPLEVLEEASSDSSSRFFVRIREELGLAYAVGTSLMLGLAPGVFAVYAATAPESVDQVAEVCREELQRLAIDGLTVTEFERARTKLLAQIGFQKQSLENYAHGLALHELYGLGVNYSEVRQRMLQDCTAEQVQAVARKYLMDKASITVIVKP
jgi:zinc protease